MVKGLGDGLMNKVNEKWIEVELNGLQIDRSQPYKRLRSQDNKQQDRQTVERLVKENDEMKIKMTKMQEEIDNLKAQLLSI